MHQLHQQTHVAQQSIRKKLRVISAAPTSHQSDDSADSGTALEVRQSELDAQRTDHSGHFEVSSVSLRGYDGTLQHPNMNDILPLQKGDMMISDQYDIFSTGAEFLVPPSKRTSSVLTSSGELLGLSSPLVGNFCSGEGLALNSGGLPPQAISSLAKNACWTLYDPQNIAAHGAQGMLANACPTSNVQNSMDGYFIVGTNSQMGAYGSMSKDLLMSSYTGANVQPESMQFLLMNSGFNAHPDTPTAANMGLGGPTERSLNQESHFQKGGQDQEHLVGIGCPPQALSSASLSSPRSSLTTIADPTITRTTPPCNFPTITTNAANNSWRNEEELMFAASGEARKIFSSPASNSFSTYRPSIMQDISDCGLKVSGFGYNSVDSDGIVNVANSNRCSTENTSLGPAAKYGQTLNLSLSSQRPSAMQLHDFDLQVQRNMQRTESAVQLEALDSNMLTADGQFNFLSSSRYLKATQQLLSEVCNVERDRRKLACRSELSTSRETSSLQNLYNPSKDAPTTLPSTSIDDYRGHNSLRLEERQDCESKKSKLVNMLQEVDKHYGQYNDHMQVLINSFDSIAGIGAATPYTALACQAMSRYFRCLRDAISGQIQVICRALGEEDIAKQITKKGSTSRLRYMGQQLHQQRAFQLGIMQQHAWRPQRGLPERSVSILRAWLFEHFLHPYPKDADKIMLAKQAGLTRSQVSNWFINARVRLWKPMVEEMYQEEVRDQIDADVRREEGRDSTDFEEGNAEGLRRTHCKVESNCAQNYPNLGLVDGNSHFEGGPEGQNFLEGNMIASNYTQSNILSMRKQIPRAMIHASGTHLLEEIDKESLLLAQDKRSRICDQEPVIGQSNMHIDVAVKSNDTHNNAIDVSDKKFVKMFSRDENEPYGFSLNGSMHANVECYGAYEGSVSKCGVGGGYDSKYPGNSVSLTLGLRRCDSLSAAQQAYLQGYQNATLRTRESVDGNNNEFGNF